MEIVTSDSTEQLFWPSDSDIPEDVKNGIWDPPDDEILKLYETFERSGGVLELEWKSSGRREPTPEFGEAEPTSVTPKVPANDENQAAAVAMDFDFDQPTTQVRGPLRIRTPGTGELKGGARKKTASMESVISSMRKHGLTGPSASPSNTPSSSPRTGTTSTSTDSNTFVDVNYSSAPYATKSAPQLFPPGQLDMNAQSNSS